MNDIIEELEKRIAALRAFIDKQSTSYKIDVDKGLTEVRIKTIGECIEVIKHHATNH